MAPERHPCARTKVLPMSPVAQLSAASQLRTLRGSPAQSWRESRWSGGQVCTTIRRVDYRRVARKVPRSSKRHSRAIVDMAVSFLGHEEVVWVAPDRRPHADDLGSAALGRTPPSGSPCRWAPHSSSFFPRTLQNGRSGACGEAAPGSGEPEPGGTGCEQRLRQRCAVAPCRERFTHTTS